MIEIELLKFFKGTRNESVAYLLVKLTIGKRAEQLNQNKSRGIEKKHIQRDAHKKTDKNESLVSPLRILLSHFLPHHA